VTLSFKPLVLAVLLSPLAVFAAKEGNPARDFTMIFVGGSAGDGTTPTLTKLKERLQSLEPKNAVVVFTGNYSVGELPSESDVGRDTAERHILAHVLATQDFYKRGGKVYFLVGHQDFAEGGTKAVRRLRKFLNSAFEAVLGERDPNDKNTVDVMPEAACGTPTRLEVTDKVGLLLVNSQWWMQDWLGDPDFNEGCEAKTRKSFQGNLMDMFRSYRNRRLVIASHHPMASYGQLGGAFTAGAHASPFPIVGTAWVLARQAGLVPQYQNHPMVNSYVELVLNEADRNGSYVFASGHDANLQHLTLKRQAQVISGTSAMTAAPAVGADEGDFSASVSGWAELALDPTGAGEARYFSSNGEPLFQKMLPDLATLAAVPTDAPAAMPPGPFIAGYSKSDVWNVPGFVQLFIGSYYSDAFLLKLPYPVLDLKTEQGGLVPFKAGGGLQSNSIRAHDPAGGDWAIRATTKDSSRLLPYPLNQVSVLGRLLDHGFTATHPEAALAVPPLATAAGIFHLRPRLMYLPDQDGLGEYRGFITDEVVMLEQRPNEMKEGFPPEHLGGKDGIRYKDYDEAVEKMLDKPLKHRFDQEAMLRARLLDILIGDWDRHRGQWRFAVNDADGVKTYTPIPLDRDQVFGNYDGIGLMFARLFVPQARSLQPFTGNFGRLGWLNYNARDVDALMLNRVTKDRWMAIAAEMKAALTDPVIDAALATWHPESFALDGARIVEALKERRDKLVDVADDYYELLNADVDVTGSNSDDRFDLTFEETGAVRVMVSGREKGARPYYDRTFQPDETSELNLYALEGNDVLAVHGAPHTRIGVRFVGGRGKDDVAAVGGSAADPVHAKAIHFYDSENGAVIDPSVVVQDQRSSQARLNQYEQRENHEPDYGAFMPGLLVNPDDGVYLGGAFTYVVQGFKKAPFAARHSLSAYFATATLGLAADYHGLFPQSAALLDQQLDLAVRTPTYTRNFYGYTNAYTNDLEAVDFYRVRQARYEGRYGLSYGFGGDRSRIGAQLVGQAIVTENTPGRIVQVSPDVTKDALGPRYFAGARVFAETNTYDSLTLPRRGVALHASVEGRYDVVKGNQLSTNYKLAGAVAIPIDRHQRFVILSRAVVEGIVGEHPFYFAPTLGDGQLRAYHQQQLAGDVAFAQTTDLRIDVFRIGSVVPGTIGINLSVDHGRVFGSTINSDYYHMNYGGGVWWSIVDLIGVQLSYHRGLDGGERISLAVGPLFSNTGF
jgi:hypothetical protein